MCRVADRGIQKSVSAITIHRLVDAISAPPQATNTTTASSVTWQTRRRVQHMQFITTSSITVSTTPVEPEPDWHDEANCLGVDPDLFFPERGASTREAKEVCRGCVVQHDCLEFALQNGEKFGIWGGLSERERRRIRRQRAQAARSTIGA